jgi:hypothetical protein
MSKRPWFTGRKNWITATAIVLLKVEDNTKAATLKAQRYLSSRLNEKMIKNLIKIAFLKLEYVAPGLEGKERLFIRQHSETHSRRQRLGAAAVRGAVEAAVTEMIDYLFGL